MASIKLPGPSWWLSAALWVVRALRRWGLTRRKIIQPVKNWYLLGPLHDFHIKAVHRWRDLFLRVPHYATLGELPLETKELCNACRDVIAEILDLPNARIHCTLKALVEKPDAGEALVVTIGRSDLHDRPAEFGLEKAHLVEKNTVWAALCGKNDGHRTWEQPYSFFGCNNLPKYADDFICDRENWTKYYKSTMVLPLRFYSYKEQKHKILGFLTFDMPTTGEFTNLPDVFEHKWHEYHELAAGCSVLHAGGIMADTLTLLFWPVLETKELANA